MVLDVLLEVVATIVLNIAFLLLTYALYRVESPRNKYLLAKLEGQSESTLNTLKKRITDGEKTFQRLIGIVGILFVTGSLLASLRLIYA